MGRASIFSRETIIAAGLLLVRKQGECALTARALGKMMGCSTSPLFTACGSFEEIRVEVKKAAIKEFCEYVKDSINYVPALKEFGLRFVKFAIYEPNLYKLIFLTPGTDTGFAHPDVSKYIESIKATYGISDAQVEILFEQFWTYVCGLTALSITGAASLTEDEISDRLSRQFNSSVQYLQSESAKEI